MLPTIANMPRMTKAEALAYRARWQLVEAQVYAEARNTTMAQRWQALHELWGFAAAYLPELQADYQTQLIRERWIILRQRLAANYDLSITSRRLGEFAGYYAHDVDGPLAQAIGAVTKLLSAFDNQGVVIGGVAVALIGRPRLTRDVDATVLCDFDQLELLLQLAATCDLHPRIVEAVEFARESRVVLFMHTPTQISVDVSLGVMPFEHEVVARAVIHQLGGIPVRLPTPEDLIIYKAVSHRLKDLQDVYDLIQINPGIDRTRIRYWVQEFAAVLEMPELWEDIAPWLN
jgi:hypothetical protein